MFVLLLILWIILNGRITVEIILFGIGISAVLYLFISKFMNYSFSREIGFWRGVPKITRYVIFLIIEVIKANLAVAGMIVRGQEPDPVIIRFRTNIKTATMRVLLANSITLTPGTITVDLTDDVFIVHGLHRSFVEGIDDNDMVRNIVELEKTVKADEIEEKVNV